jgi:hypothetical protein
MKAEEYTDLVSSIARSHVCENKPIHKAVAKAVIKLTPMAVLANSMREPTEDELLEVVEQHNPFAVENLSEELRTRYTAVCKLTLDVNASVKVFREERLRPVSYRILESSQSRYLTWAESDPDCDSTDDDKMAEYKDRETAEQHAKMYQAVMQSLDVQTEVEVVSFNRYHERIS